MLFKLQSKIKRINASVISHPGNCRENNEDNFCFNGMNLSDSLTLEPIKYLGKTSSAVIMGVFDGMGGIEAGERASYIASETACTAMLKIEQADDLNSFMVDICKTANNSTCEEMLNVIKKRIGSTASMLCFRDSKYYLCNIGDSPIFIYRDNELTPIFHEHTEKEDYLKIHGKDAVMPNKKFRLTQNIGIFPEEMEIEPFTYSSDMKSKDRFLICSDGLTDMVDECKIKDVLSQGMSPSKTVKKLLKMALDNGGKDNTTIICIDVK